MALRDSNEQSFSDIKHKAWLLLAYGDEQTYAGHSGYDDVVHEVYRYDNFVPNHKRISEGDFAVIRDQKELLGLARIVLIDVKKGFKKRNRCPIFSTTNIDRRTTKSPIFRCTEGHEFDEPAQNDVSCLHYSAHFGDTFISARGVLNRHQLSQACPRYNQQLAMQEISLEKILPVIAGTVYGVESLVSNSETQPRISVSESSEKDVKQQEFAKEVIRQIKERQGQKKFRETLRHLYKDRCVVTSCAIVDILEAAHISPYSIDFNNAMANGLLLRSDIHTLFDLNLLGINPQTLTLHFHPDIKDEEYKKYEGTVLSVIAQHANRNALKLRWEEFNRVAKNRIIDT